MSLASLIIPAIALIPLGMALLLLPTGTRSVAVALAPWAALPAFLVAVLGAPEGPVAIGWFLIGAELGLDPVRRVFLLLTAGLWLAAGIFAGGYHRGDPKRAPFFAYFLVTLAGNLGLVVALDAATFYLFFILMSIAAFGLIVHEGTPEARRAAVTYLILVVLGEVMILPGLWLAVTNSVSLRLTDIAQSVAELGAPVMLLLTLGFGVKAGALPLHVWLPLAHPVAPTPASAVLSGAMVKAGLLAWVVHLPLGLGAFPGMAFLFVAAGVVAAFYGAVIGVMQANPKAVLAYSTVSQMGLVSIAVGAALWAPEALPAALTAILVYALHHALAKGALFLGVGIVDNAGGVRDRRLALGLLLLPALSLSGAPLTSGILAKTALKEAAHELSPALDAALTWLLPLAALGTALLMARYLWLLARRPADSAKGGLWPPWLALLGAVAIVSWLPLVAGPDLIAESLAVHNLWSGLWPIAAALALAVAAASGIIRPLLDRIPRVPEGDILWPIRSAILALRRLRTDGVKAWSSRLGDRLHNMTCTARTASGPLLDRAERMLARWDVVGAASLAALLGAFALLI